MRLGIDQSRFPVRAVDFLSEEKVEGNLFSPWGDVPYVIWRLYPKLRTFIPWSIWGHRDDVVADYYRIQNATDGWASALDRYGVTLVVSNHEFPLSYQLASAPVWKLIHVDEKTVIYAKDVPERRDLIARQGYRVIRPDGPLLCADKDAGAALAELDRALRGDPTSGRLYCYQAQVLAALGRTSEAEVAGRLAVQYDPLIGASYALLAKLAEARGDVMAARVWSAEYERIMGAPAGTAPRAP